MSSDLPPIPQIEPSYGAEEIRAVSDYLHGGGWLTEHVRTRQFEKELATFTGAKHCVVTSNGTMSLVATLLALGIGPGDEVIVPDFTMIASANAVKLAGASPVLVDVDAATLCADVEQIGTVLTDRTKAVMAVSLNGRSPRMSELRTWCHSRGMALVEDAAQSLGSRWQGRHLGTFGRAGCFSFSPHKIITTGQGGAVVTDDGPLAERIRMIKDFGRRQSGTDTHDILGYNFKFTDLQAVIGLEQLRKIDVRIARKKAMFAAYRERLDGLGTAVRFTETDLSETTPWFMDALVQKRSALRGHLERDSIETRPFYPAIHRQPAYAQNPAESGSHEGDHSRDVGFRSFPVAERISEEGLWLPSSLKLTDRDIDRVCASIRHFYGRER